MSLSYSKLYLIYIIHTQSWSCLLCVLLRQWATLFYKVKLDDCSKDFLYRIQKWSVAKTFLCNPFPPLVLWEFFMLRLNERKFTAGIFSLLSHCKCHCFFFWPFQILIAFSKTEGDLCFMDRICGGGRWGELATCWCPLSQENCLTLYCQRLTEVGPIFPLTVKFICFFQRYSAAYLLYMTFKAS